MPENKKRVHFAPMSQKMKSRKNQIYIVGKVPAIRSAHLWLSRMDHVRAWRRHALSRQLASRRPGWPAQPEEPHAGLSQPEEPPAGLSQTGGAARRAQPTRDVPRVATRPEGRLYKERLCCTEKADQYPSTLATRDRDKSCVVSDRHFCATV